ncbi:hypothetical protein, partial [Micromonospora andamanensis]|uniref:hypothetical protein n=1 Tax=Micromonospora andamanensis TaxID=1287068 RepID=UPI0019524DED
RSDSGSPPAVLVDQPTSGLTRASNQVCGGSAGLAGSPVGGKERPMPTMALDAALDCQAR